MSQNETAKATIYLDGKQAEAAIDALKKKSKELKVQLDEARKAGDTITMKKLENEIRSVDTASRSLLKDSFDVEKVLKNINKVSWRDLEKAQKAVVSEMKRMERGTAEYASKAKSLEKITAELNRTRGVMKQKESMWGSLANGANKYFNMITLGIATLTGVVFSMSQFVKGMVGLDDALANVQKTTGLTRKQVKEMYQDFKNLNTRTPRAELLALAEEAGRLGRTGKKDIMAFVEVANKIKIALGDDLGGNAELAIREVGKLTEIFRVGNQYGTDFKTSMEKVGSGINEVANNSNASAEFLIEYMKRLGGISTQAKITAADIMGYASTFDQLGQNVEMAATAQSKVVVDMFADPGKYAKIAKMEVMEFSQLLKTDANEAFIRFLEGLNGNNEGLSEMAVKLDSLGIDGARAAQALASLSSNTKMLREQQILANGAMERGISLNNEYAVKNDNLAGSWEKLTTFISSKFINSNFLGFLEKVIGKLSKMTEVTHPLTKAMREEVTSVNLLSIELTNSNTPAQRRNEIYAELKKIAPDVVANIDAENISISTLRDNLEKYNAEMIKKLALQDSEETLADKRESAGKATNDRIEKELKLQKEMNSLLQTYKSFDPKIAKEIDDILFSNTTVLDKYNKLVKAVGNVNFSPKTSQSVAEALKNEKEATDAVNESLSAYMERYEMIFGKDKPAPTPPPPAPPIIDPPSDNSVIPTDPANAKSATDAFDLAYKQQLLLLKQRYEGEETLQKEYKARMLATELAYLKVKEQMETNQISKVDLQSQIIDKQREYTAALKEAAPEMIKSSEEIAIFNTRLLEESKLLGLAAKKQSDGAAAQEEYTAKQIQQADTIKMIGDVMTDYVTGALSGSLDEYQTFGDTLILMSLQMLKMMVPIWSAQILGLSLASAESVATWGVAGMAKYTAITGLMYAGISAVEGIVKSGINSRREAASGSKQSGGYSNTDGPDNEPDGIYHKGEFIASAPAVRNPTVKPILDVIDMAQRSGTIRSLNLRAMLPTGSKQSGGYGSAQDGSTSPVIIPGASSDPELTAALNMNTKAIALLMKNGVQFPIVPFKKDLDELSDLLDQPGMPGFRKK